MERIISNKERFSIFAIIKLESWDEYDKFVEICIPNDVVLSMAITSDSFWYLFKEEKQSWAKFPFYCRVKKDNHSIRFAYIDICFYHIDFNNDWDRKHENEIIKNRNKMLSDYAIYGASLNEFEDKLKTK